MAVKIKEISNSLIKMLLNYQKMTYNFSERPGIDDAKMFLARNGVYTKRNLSVLLKYNDTRYKRERLTKEQFKEWYEFYFM